MSPKVAKASARRQLLSLTSSEGKANDSPNDGFGLNWVQYLKVCLKKILYQRKITECHCHGSFPKIDVISSSKAACFYMFVYKHVFNSIMHIR